MCCIGRGTVVTPGTYRLLENEQKLRLVDKSVSEPEEVEPDQERKLDQEENPEPEKKKARWLRFFS